MSTLVEPDDAPVAEPGDDEAAVPTPRVRHVPPMPDGRLGRLRHRIRYAPVETWVGVAIVAACVAFVATQLQLGLVLARTTPAGGDMGAHVWGPAFIRDELLPHFRLTGWTKDYYAGFPAFQFYMLPPAILTIILDLVLPYGIALKLVTISGTVALPVCAYLMGRLLRLPFPGPPLLAVATMPFLFDRTWTIYGGNVPSTLAGEYSFSISLALALLFFGVMARSLETGRHRGLAAVLLASSILCHAIPAFFALAGGVILVALSRDRARIRFALPVLVLGCGLTAFWSVPFVLRRGYLTDMGWETLTDHSSNLVPHDMRWVVVLALVGLVLSLAFSIRAGVFLALVGAAFGVGFVFDAAGPVHIWNARLLPFLYLSYSLLAAVGVSEVLRSLAVIFDREQDRRRRTIEVGGAGLGLLFAVVIVGMPLHSLPFGSTSVDPTGAVRYHWMGLSTTDDSFVDSWAKWNYSGYERKAAYPEYRSLIQTMAQVGEDEGCGRAHWEYDQDLNRFGTPMALMLLPFWTDGCIGSEEGLYFESAGTTPFHFLTASEVSPGSSNPVRDQPDRPMPYNQFGLDLGVAHMRLLGTKYYMAYSDQAKTAAAQHPDLTLVATSDSWEVFEISDSEIVAPLTHQPAVMTDLVDRNPEWQKDAVAWFMDPTALDVVLAEDGPADWQRVRRGESPDRRDVEPTVVSNIDEQNLSISFDVDRVGQPILVKTSYFPNWSVRGAEGPYRVTPNLMVVVPTDEHVELHYDETGVEYLGWGTTVLSILGVALLARRGRRRFASPVDRTLFPDLLDPRGFVAAEVLVAAFAEEVLGFARPDLVELDADHPAARRFEVRSHPGGPPVQVEAQRLPDRHWYVVAARSGSLHLRVPRAGAEVGDPIQVAGSAAGQHLRMGAQLYVDGLTAPVAEVDLVVTASREGDRVGFVGSLPVAVPANAAYGRVVVRAVGATAMARVVLRPDGAIGGLPRRSRTVGAPELVPSVVAEGSPELGEPEDRAGDPPQD